VVSETSKRVLGDGASGAWASIGRREAETLAREVEALDGAVTVLERDLRESDKRVAELEAALQRLADGACGEFEQRGTLCQDIADAALAKGGK
jgi:predicted RNase H-like nuclease (RuvC/YqgF family)